MSFELIPFSDCDLDDVFFDSLKEDYPGFDKWFVKKCNDLAKAYVWKNEDGLIHGFLYVKEEPEEEAIGELPSEPRVKIGTLKIDDSIGGQRIGEGAIGIALWTWQRMKLDKIYVTIFPKHESLIKILENFGFVHVTDKGGERVYQKSKKLIDRKSPKTYFPYILSDCRGRVLPILSEYHDRMFQYSELKNTDQSIESMPVSNGITKYYLAFPPKNPDYRINDLVFIYRMADEDKQYKSVISSFCVVSGFQCVKENGNVKMTKEQYLKTVGNKTVFSSEELESFYTKPNLYLIELLYCGYFGAGNNVNYNKLKSMGIWKNQHPYQMILSEKEIRMVLNEGKICVEDITID